ncbi:enoyl-CoA hydratase/isomerase family protein [Bacillus sp. 1P06AnD]|uniref:enoyl-CoA hydratase/isomerase family protein n=1 Tax=Bacillus sp. 1P06AnD TaxID=3132208 RepID=UPI0039A1CE79
MMKDILLKEKREQGILILRLNRPEKRNAISFSMIAALGQALEEAANDPQVNALIVTGTGEAAFCSGGDLDDFHSLANQKEAFAMLSQMGDVLYKLAVFPKPTIAYINGAAVGGGCEIAAACDFRLAAPGAKVGFIQGNQAITTGWGGASLILEKMASSNAMEMLFSGKVYSTELACSAGFIQKSVPSLEHAVEYAGSYCQKLPQVLAAYKQVLIEKWEASSLEDRMKKEILACSYLWESEQHMDAVRAFREKKR